MSTILMNVAGVNLPLFATQAKGKETVYSDGTTSTTPGNTYWVFRDEDKKATSFGAAVPALAPEFPTTIVVDGEPITLTKGYTATEYKGVPTGKPARPNATATGVFTFPTIGEPKRFTFAVSLTKSGEWNITSRIYGVGGTTVSPVAAANRLAAFAKYNA